MSGHEWGRKIQLYILLKENCESETENTVFQKKKSIFAKCIGPKSLIRLNVLFQWFYTLDILSVKPC